MVISPFLMVTLTRIGTGSPLLHAVVVDGGFRLVDAVGKLRDHVAAFLLGLVEDRLDGGEDGVAAVFVEHLVHALGGEPAGRHLRFHVAERGFREADVVLEHAVERLVELAGLVDLQLVELQPLEPRIGDRRARAEAGRHAADVDPVRAHHHEHQELALVEIGRVDDDVVEVLAGDRLVVGDDDVARLEALGAVALHAVDDDDAEIGDEVRHAADVLRHELAVGRRSARCRSRAPRRSSCCRRCAAGRPPSRWRRPAAHCGSPPA